MVGHSFAPFPHLPIEIRHMIWAAAIWPRLVHLRGRHQQTNAIDANALKAIPCDYLFSTSPIPPLLLVNRDSREAMKRHGYRVAFGTRRSAARTWFNFQHDVLYLFGDILDHSYDSPYLEHPLNCQDAVHYIAQSSPTDLAQVKKVALQATLSIPGLSNIQFGLFPPYYPKPMPIFGQLEELLIVEEHYRDTSPSRSHDSFLNDINGNLWGYIDCDTADVLSTYRDFRDFFRQRHSIEIYEYKKSTQSNGKEYFRDLARKFEDEIRLKKDLILGEDDEDLTIPNVRVVSVVTKNRAWKLLKQRHKYWTVIQRMEDRVKRTIDQQPLLLDSALYEAAHEN